MTIFINGEERDLIANTLAELLEKLALPEQRIAVELNKRVIRRQDWTETVVSDRDRVEIVHFVGGG